MKKFFLKFILFCSPIVLIVFVHAIFVPIDSIYFRSWEALSPKLFFDYYSGPFYPNMTLQKNEKGDLAPHTDLTVTKNVIWHTDAYGYRTDDMKSHYDIVIVGDSNTVGSGLTQQDTLSAMLEKKIGTPVYPYAPAKPKDFLKDQRFENDLPKVVIFELIERDVPKLNVPTMSELEALKATPKENLLSSLTTRIKLNPYITGTVDLLDQSFDPTVLRYTADAVTGKTPAPLYAYATGTMLFYQGDAANVDVSMASINDIVDGLQRYNDIFKEMGIHMIFLPIPNKENIYYKMLPLQKKPVFLDTLIPLLRARGIDTIDLETSFREAYAQGVTNLYHTDDTHWNAGAVAIAAAEIAGDIAKNPIK